VADEHDQHRDPAQAVQRRSVPELGYGSRGAGSAIKPGETLVFVVDLLGVR
jgi:FKBP-type peptidyl-prolyl cis-trans isomerase